MKKIITLAFVVFALSACGGANDAAPTPTLNAAQMAFIQATSSAADFVAATAQSAALTATMESYIRISVQTEQARQTQAAQETQTAYWAAVHLQETQQAAQATSAAQATATERAWQATSAAAQATSAAAVSQATATAQAQATATAWSMAATQTVYDALSTERAVVLAQQQAQATADARRLNLDIERRELTNNGLALAPYVVGVIVLALTVWLLFILANQYTMQQAIVRDASNNPVMVIRREGSRTILLQPGRMLRDNLIADKSGVYADETAPLDAQVEVTHRDQNLTGVRVLAQTERGAPEARRLASGMGSSKPRAKFLVMQGADRLPPGVDAATVEAIDAEWREANDSE